MRYILVRILIAVVIIGLIRYFINLYFRIQQERLDLIRKEEALSTLFYMLESKDGKINEITGNVVKGSKKYKNLKIPLFPINKLFEASYNKNQGKKDEVDESQMDNILDKFNLIITTQKEFYEGLLHKLNLDKEK